MYTVPSVAGVTYNWSYSGSGATINGTGNSITVDYDTDATSGILSVTATNSCGTSTMSRDISIIVKPDATLSPTELNSINVFPNPFDNYSMIEINLNTGAETDLEVYSIVGNKILTLMKGEFLPAGSNHIKLSEITSGIYILKLKIGNREKNIPIVKN
jgi:hypothetical protein